MCKWEKILTRVNWEKWKVMETKVLVVTTISGFLAKFEMNDVKIMQDNGCTVHYATNFKNPVYEDRKEELKQKGIKLHHIGIQKSPLRLFKNTRALIQLIDIIKREKIEMIHCHNPMGGVLGRLAAVLSGQKVYTIYTAHGFHFYDGAPLKNWLLFYPIEKFLARFTDKLITINHEDYLRARKFKMKKNGQAVYIPGVGIDVNKFARKPGCYETERAKWKIPENAFHVVSVGELNDNKNHEIIIDVLSDPSMKDVYYTICGKGTKHNELLMKIEKSGLSGRVQLLGYRTDIEQVLQSADCFAFPSKREGLGIASLEALACGVPIVATDNRGTREYVIHNRNGYMCDLDAKDQFKDAILRLKNDGEKRRQMQESCVKTANKFSIESTDRIMRGVYKSALECVRKQRRG